MPFDPNKPANGSPNSSAEMRAQFNGLKDLIAEASGVTSVVIDGVTTLPPGSPAAVTASVVGTQLHFSFELPQGAEGAPGQTGSDGSDGLPGAPGQQGPQGVPGEVSLTELNNGLLNTLTQTSNNSNGVSTLSMVVSDPPTQSEVQTIADKLEELINVLRR